jgi:DNA repair protein RadC
MEIGAAVLREAGSSLSELARTPVQALRRIPGVGPARASRLVASMEVGRRVSREAWTAPRPIRGARDVFEFMEPRLRDLLHEEFHVLLLDAQHGVMRDVTVTRGILNASLVHPREVFRPAIAHSAASVILVHNHPSGDPTPSADDRAVTRQMRAAGETLGIAVLDHVVVARGGYASAE